MVATEEGYVELHISTAFSFLRGASRPNEIVQAAVKHGYKRIAITDRNNLYGVVQAYREGRRCGVEIIPGAEVTLSDAKHSTLILLPIDRRGYAHLCRLITLGQRRTAKGDFDLALSDIAEQAEGIIAIHIGHIEPFLLAREKAVFGDRLYLGINRRFVPDDFVRWQLAEKMSARFEVPLVVTGGVLMHGPERKPLQDILTCIRFGLKIDEAGRFLNGNDAGYLRAPCDMKSIFPRYEDALARTIEIADKCSFRLDELNQEFVLEVLPPGETGASYLHKLVARGVEERWPDGPTDSVRSQIAHELKIIEDLKFEGYFLTVWDIVRWARSQGILCQGRGSAANSIVCYVLGITSIDPIRMDLLFERFISMERNEPPDIDVDFEHDRREEVMQYVFRKYGRERAAMVANIVCYRDRLAFREVAKVFGLGEDQIARLSKTRSHWGATPLKEDDLRASGLDPTDKRVRNVVRWGAELVGFPRHLGLHSGGFVITKEPLIDVVPVENATMAERTVIAWDKRDVEALGFVKVDLLALGMLSVLRRSFDYIRQNENLSLNLNLVPAEDDRVYAMIQAADTIGTFQIESRAQMQMLPRLKPKTFYDLVVSVAIVRPGPIQGDMIHPYLRRRDGLESTSYPHPALEAILGKTYGVPLFQEQVMKMAVAVAGFSPGEADQLRRAIGWQSQVQINTLRDRFICGMLANGLERDFAERVFRMIQGFGGYGFPESHAASFALLGYASCYLKRYHPAAFLAALLNSQPMGFYRPHTLVADAQRHGVEVRPVSINDSLWDACLETPSESYAHTWWASQKHPVQVHTPWQDAVNNDLRYGRALQPAVRLGFRSINGLGKKTGERLIEARSQRAFADLGDLVRRAGLNKEQATRLVTAGALGCLGYDRRRALWEVLAFEQSGPLFAGITLRSSGCYEDPTSVITPMDRSEHIRADYESVGMCLDHHPMELLRASLREQGVLGAAELDRMQSGRKVEVGGLVITRQRPSTAQGVVFITLEDEYGHINLVVFNQVFNRFKSLARDSTLLRAQGRLERAGKVINIIVESFGELVDPAQLEVMSRDFR